MNIPRTKSHRIELPRIRISETCQISQECFKLRSAGAVADARDFLRRAQVITIASVTDEKPLPEEDPGSRLAEYLTRHGIQTTVAGVQSHGRPIAQSLQEHAREIGADMLVM